MASVIELCKTNSLANVYLTFLRDKHRQQDRLRFRLYVERLSGILAYEMSKALTYETISIETPLAPTKGMRLKTTPVIAGVLRAALLMLEVFMDYFDHADSAFVTAYRKYKSDNTFDIVIDYLAAPPLEQRPLILVDPMIATGTTLIKVYERLIQNGKPSQVLIGGLIASEQGIRTLQQALPTAKIWTFAIDPELNPKAYIVPGLGDAGDLLYGPRK